MQSTITMRGSGRGVTKLLQGSRQILTAQLHGTPDLRHGAARASTVLAGKCCGGKHAATHHAKPEILSPLISTGGLPTASGIIRGFNSSIQRDASADDGGISHLLENNRQWVSQKTSEDPDFFKRLASVHQPEFLFIGCSDARYTVQQMLGLEAGQIFVHRNVANLVMHNDLSLLTVLNYAVEFLKVKHIIVCGHYDCGGVRAASKNHDHGLIENWIMGVKDVARLHQNELQDYKDDEAFHRRLVELNVQEQCVKLYANPVVQRSKASGGGPHIHPMVYDIAHGFVKELDIDFKSILGGLKPVYSVYDMGLPKPQ